MRVVSISPINVLILETSTKEARREHANVDDSRHKK
jgi:hypothetical protein